MSAQHTVDQSQGRDAAVVNLASDGHETAKWRVAWEVRKYAEDYDRRIETIEEFEARHQLVEIVKSKGNLLLNEGIARMLNLTIGAGGTAYNNANARLGVGNSSTAAAAGQTGLQGGSTTFKAMDPTFPSLASQTLTFQSTFGSGDGNHAWDEWTIDNGAGANENMNRKVEALGTKTTGTWILTVTVTLS